MCHLGGEGQPLQGSSQLSSCRNCHHVGSQTRAATFSNILGEVGIVGNLAVLGL